MSFSQWLKRKKGLIIGHVAAAIIWTSVGRLSHDIAIFGDIEKDKKVKTEMRDLKKRGQAFVESHRDIEVPAKEVAEWKDLLEKFQKRIKDCISLGDKVKTFRKLAEHEADRNRYNKAINYCNNALHILKNIESQLKNISADLVKTYLNKRKGTINLPSEVFNDLNHSIGNLISDVKGEEAGIKSRIRFYQDDMKKNK